MTLFAFVLFLTAFAAVGLSSTLVARKDRDDYLIAGSRVPPWLVGLSAVATNNSGYMFIGVIGYTYATGLPAAWLMIGWIAGDLVASQFVHRKLRDAVGRFPATTFAGILAGWHGTAFGRFRLIAATVTVLFLGAYAAAQLNAGSKALTGLFGWEAWAGATLSAAIVLAYCWAGGLRASIWTDAAQSFVMLIAMATMLSVAVADLGGPGQAYRDLVAVDPTYMSPWPTGLAVDGATGTVLFIVGWLFAGFSVVGQPHIMVRFMALDEAGHTTRARIWYYSFFIVFYLMANAVGLLSRVLLDPGGSFDAEMALPLMAQELLHPFLVGMILAGVFAASMSTADSLVLSCSAAISEDFVPGRERPLWTTKLATVCVTLLALAIAITGPSSVFALVVVSWSVLGAAFGPLLLVYALGARPSERLALAMTITGVALVFAVKNWPLLAGIYEGFPAIVGGFLVFGLGHLLGETAPAVEGTPAIAEEPDPARS